MARFARPADGLSAHVPVRPDGDVSALTVQFESLVEPLRFDRRPDTQGPEVLRRLCGTYAMGPFEVTICMRGEHTLALTAPGAPTLDLEPIIGDAALLIGAGAGILPAMRTARLSPTEALWSV